MDRCSWRIAFLTLVLGACTQADPRPLSLETLAVQPGTQVTKWTEPNGSEVVEIRRGGVVITRTTQGELAEDESGYGAIMCARAFLLYARGAIETCGSSDDASLKAYLDGAIDEVDDFIVANSLKPITKSELAGQVAKDLNTLKVQIQSLPAGVRQKRCEGSDEWRKARDWAAELTNGRYIRDLLSMPRPPVANPCA